MHPPLPDSLKTIVDSLSKKEAEKLSKEQQEDDAQFASLLKKQKLLEIEKNKENHEIDEDSNKSLPLDDQEDYSDEEENEDAVHFKGLLEEESASNASCEDDDYDIY